MDSFEPRLERKHGPRQPLGVHNPIAVRPIGVGHSGMARTTVLACEDNVQCHGRKEASRTEMAAVCDSLDKLVVRASDDARRARAHQHSLLCAAPFDCHL